MPYWAGTKRARFPSKECPGSTCERPIVDLLSNPRERVPPVAGARPYTDLLTTSAPGTAAPVRFMSPHDIRTDGEPIRAAALLLREPPPPGRPGRLTFL